MTDNRTQGRLSKLTDSVSFPRDLGQVCLPPTHSHRLVPNLPRKSLVCTLCGEGLGLDAIQLHGLLSY